MTRRGMDTHPHISEEQLNYLSMPMSQRRWLHFAVLCTVVGVGSSTEVFDALGCAAFKSTEKECFVKDVEVLPSIHISESAIHAGIKTAEDCQKKCLEFYDCKYFTFRTNKADKTTTCHLKPAPGGAAAPVMVVRSYPSNSQYSYVSGPADCHGQCTEWKEVVPGCGGASPSSCALMSNGNAGFDATCATTPDKKGCVYNGFNCCLDCKKGACCTTRVKGKLLVDGKLLGSDAVGVATPEHCHSLCLATAGCTHWNYVASSTSAYIGGACYRRTYDPLNSPKFETAPAYVTSVVGSVDCSKDYGLNGDPGTCQEENVDFPNTLAIDFTVTTMEGCGKLCRETPACHFYMMKWNHCYLKYSDDGKTTTKDQTLMAPRDCHSSVVDDGCFLPSTVIEGVKVRPTFWSDQAVACARACNEDSGCIRWSHTDAECTLFKTVDKTVPKKNYISGEKNCNLPQGNKRQLDEHPEKTTTVPRHCIHKNMSFSGQRLISIQKSDALMTVEECYTACLETPHCNMLSATADGRVCDLYKTGTLVDVQGVISVQRECPEVQPLCDGQSDVCPSSEQKPSVRVA